MKKIILVICFVLLCALPTQSGVIMLSGEGTATSGGTPSNGVIGSTQTNDNVTYTAQYIMFNAFTPTTAGDITYCHLAVNAAPSAAVALGVYNSSGVLLGYGSATCSATGWLNIALNTTVTLTESTTYWLGFQTAGGAWSMGVNFYSLSGSARTCTASPCNSYSATSSPISDAGEFAAGTIRMICNTSSGDPS